MHVLCASFTRMEGMRFAESLPPKVRAPAGAPGFPLTNPKVLFSLQLPPTWGAALLAFTTLLGELLPI